MQSQLGQPSQPCQVVLARYRGHCCAAAVLRHTPTTNARTASLTAVLPSSYQFDFLDAPLECEPAPEIRGIYPGPYYCFFKSHSEANMAQAVNFVREVVEEDGPYDCVIGFSQGASVAAAYLALAQRSPSFEASIKMAVFICAALINPKIATSNELTRTIGALGRIGIPTLHIIGLKDPCYAQSMQLVKSCEMRTACTVFHGGGHDVPRDAAHSAKMAGEIERRARVAFSGMQ